jgi:peptidoglycan/LPS O-acetylase OafA/YrhL
MRKAARLNNIDALRLLAATQVLLVHGLEHFAGAETWARAAVAALGLFPGVPLFFFLSGLLITMSVDRSDSLAAYGLRRVLRIYPGLSVCLVVSVASVAAAGYPLPVLEPRFWTWLGAHLTFGQIYNPDFLRGYGVGVLNGSLWTIFVELQFYVLAPLMLIALRAIARRRWALIGIVLTLAIVNEHASGLRAADHGLLVKLYAVTIVPYLFFFVLGGAAYVLGLHEREYSRHDLAYALALHVGLAVGTALVAGERFGGNLLLPYLGATLCAVGLVASFTRPFAWSGLIENRDYSYGIYLYHMPVINALMFIAGRSGELLLPAVAATVVIATLSWHLVERPAIALGRHRRLPAGGPA